VINELTVYPSIYETLHIATLNE